MGLYMNNREYLDSLPFQFIGPTSNLPFIFPSNLTPEIDTCSTASSYMKTIDSPD